MIYYKQVEENEIKSIGMIDGTKLPEGFEEITYSEYMEMLEEIMSNNQETEPEEEPSEYETGFNEGYEQAILDMLELELEEESEE